MRKLLLCFCAVCVFFGCMGCSFGGDISSGFASDQVGENQMGESGEADVQMAYLTELSEDKHISVQLPVMSGENGAAINSLLQDFVESKLESICCLQLELQCADRDIPSGSMPDPRYSIDVDARVMWQSEDLVSIVFEGMYNDKMAAHPTNLIFAINLAPDQAKQIFFAECFTIDRALYQTFTDYAREDIAASADSQWLADQDGLLEQLCSEGKFLDGLQEEKDFYWYYTGSGIGIVYPVPHALGDYWETTVPIARLEAAQ